MSDPEQKLRLYKTAYAELENSFKNNLNVIRELQQENSELQNHLQQVTLKYESELEKRLISAQEKHQKTIQQQELEFARQLNLIKNQYETFISTLSENQQKKSQQLITALTKKHKHQIDNVKNFMVKDIENKDLQLKKAEAKVKSLDQTLKNTEDKLCQMNLRLIENQRELESLRKEKMQAVTLNSTREQELQSLKQYSSAWEDTLKQKIKEKQEEKTLAQEKMAEQRFSHNMKLKKIKDQHLKKITNLQETHSQKLNQILFQSKQIKLKYESIKQENIELKTEAEYAKRELQQTVKSLDEERLRFSSLQDSILTLREKEFQIKSLTEDVKRLQSEIKSLQDDKNTQKQEMDKVNYQRQNAEKALQRLKTELLNKTRESDEYKKELDKLKYKNKVNSYQPQTLEQVATQAKGIARYEQKDSVIGGQGPNSRCFSDDMGGEDFKFLNSQVASPKKSYFGKQENFEHEQIQNQQNNDKITHLMKRVGELQIENQEYASTIKLIKEEMERTANTINDKLDLKDQEIRLGKNENMLLREKLNDKEEQLMRMKDSIRELKEQIEKSATSKQVLEELVQIKQEKQDLQNQNKKLLSQVERLKGDVSDALKEREILQQIADDLRAELNFLKEQFDYIQQQQQAASNFTQSALKQQQTSSYYNNKNASNSYEKSYNQDQSSNQFSQIAQSNQYSQEENPSRANFQNQGKGNRPSSNKRISPQNNRPSGERSSQNHIKPKDEPSKGPKRKLHQLIKQKNILESQGAFIMGRKANLQKRLEEQRVEHQGTKSQKQIYDKLQRKSKSKSKQKSTINRLKDFELPKPERESVKLQARRHSQKQQMYNRSGHENQQDQSRNQQVSHISQDVSQEMIDQSALMKRIEMMNRMKQKSLGNDSLGEFDHLENVSMTYWEQQDQY